MTFTDGGFWKRTDLAEWTAKGRGGLGMIAMKLPEHRGSLVGAMVVDEGDQVLAITESGGVIRTRVSEEALQRRARDTMGVRLMALAEGDSVVGVARNPETEGDSDLDADLETATWTSWTGDAGRRIGRRRRAECRFSGGFGPRRGSWGGTVRRRSGGDAVRRG